MVHQLWTFGSNGEGQLGLPVADIVATPTRLPDNRLQTAFLPNIRSIKSGDNHTLFMLHQGYVFGIGDNRVAQVSTRSDAPPQLNSFWNVNHHALVCAATSTTSATISCRDGLHSSIATQGQGRWGELGRGALQDTSYVDMLKVPRLSSDLYGRPVDFAAGVWHYVLVMASGAVYGWGKARLGQLGTQSHETVTEPTKIEGVGFKPVRVVCGKDFTYLVGDRATGEHKVLGKDKFNIISDMPADVKGYKDIGATWHAIFVLFDDGTLKAWGKENQWKLLPPDLPPIDEIAVGTDHILAITKERKLISWGWAKHGNCGDVSNLRQEIRNDMISGFWNDIELPGRITKIAAGYCTSFVITVVEDEQSP